MNNSFWYLLLVVFALCVVSRLIVRWRRHVEQSLWKQVYESPVVCAAALFWKECLCRDFSPALSEEQLVDFHRLVREGITRKLMADDLVVSMGMVERRQHGFFCLPDVDAILQVAGLQLSYMRQSRIDLAQYLPMVEMRIYPDSVKVRAHENLERFEEFSVIFRVGDEIERVAEPAHAYRLISPRTR